MSILRKSLSGFLWTASEQFSVQFIQFFISIILARILLPEEFGLIGMILVFVAIGTSLRDGGLTSSLIRSENLTEEDYSTVFFSNLIGSVIIYVLLFACSPLVANFFNQPALENLLKIQSLTIIIGAFSSVQYTRLTKQMNFKKQLSVQVPSLILSGLLGIFLAFQGFGVWSLVMMTICQSLLATIQYWYLSTWRPKLIFNVERFKYHFSYGYKISLSGILNSIYNNLYHIIIGKFFSASTLGFYTRASTLKQLPVANISRALDKVTFPLFASIQNDNAKLKEAYKNLMQQIIFWLTPALVISAVIAVPLFRLLFTEKWIPAAPYFQMLCIVGIIFPLNSYNLNILKVKGRSDLYLKAEMLNKLIPIVLIIIFIKHGIYALLTIQIISTFIGFIINSNFSGKLINYKTLEQVRDLAPILALNIVFASIFYYLNIKVYNIFIWGDLPTIIISYVSGFFMYLFLAFIGRFNVYHVAIGMLKKSLKGVKGAIVHERN